MEVLVYEDIEFRMHELMHAKNQSNTHKQFDF